MRRRKFLSTLAAAPAIASLPGWRSRPSHRLRYFAVGDSVTAPHPPNARGTVQGYAELLGEVEGVDAAWFGVDGATAWGIDAPGWGPFGAKLNQPDHSPVALTYLGAGVLSRVRPHDTVSLLFGLNDARLGGGAPPNLYGDQLLGLAVQLRERGAHRVMLIGSHVAAWMSAEEAGRIDAYRDVHYELAAEHRWIVIGPDLRDYLQPEHFEPLDPWHPNQEGHGVIAEAVAQSLGHR